jgi:hypothetical protein
MKNSMGDINNKPITFIIEANNKFGMETINIIREFVKNSNRV